MSFKNFLDLRKKTEPQIKIVEKIVVQKRSVMSDVFMTFAVIFVASSVIWGISKADNIDILNLTQERAPQNFSASGVVSNVTNIFGTYISIDNANSSDDSGKTSYSFSANEVTKIENAEYVPLSISDIKVGDRIVVQGLMKDLGVIEAYRIISFSNTEKKEELVATSTEEVVATSTPTNISEENLNGQASSSTSTESASSSDTNDDQVIVATSTDTSTNLDSNTSKDSSASSTDVIPSVLPEFLTSPDESTSTPPSLPEIVEETVGAVVDIITPDTNVSISQ